ncbi:hypothetical protein JRO89_XS10G0214100 [Xanthoceras sorbifolium]|uniref:Uncharacterized protein n=1 Tax=Xanthoceras sorbifolium TaxID=99658 RepID=A0ABQ8HJV8_9ROSI|nr:hypothetical protein JRO89_XS10G0214100 [Xanthoceras sorbifolium]
MHIKQVIIEGFKSYREQVATEPFSPKINCVGKDDLLPSFYYVFASSVQYYFNSSGENILYICVFMVVSISYDISISDFVSFR